MPGETFQWNLFLQDRFSVNKGALTDIQLQSVTWELCRPGRVQFWMPWNHSKVQEIILHYHEYRLVIEGQTRHFGPIINADTTAQGTTFTAENALGYFQRRFIEFNSLEFTGVDNLGIDQAEIAWGLVNYAQSPVDYTVPFGLPDPRTLNIVQGSGSPTLRKRLRRYKWEEHAQIFDSLYELHTVDDGIDFAIEYDDTEATREFNVYYPKKINDFDGFQVRWGRNISDFAVKEDGSRSGTKVIASGGQAGLTKFSGVFEDENASTYFGQQTALISSDRLDASWLTDRTKRECRQRREPPKTIEPRTIFLPESVLLNRNEGDLVAIVIKRGRAQIEDLFRIITMTWTPRDRMVALGVIPYSEVETDFVIPPGFDI
jgi:hypothetical protein